MRGPERQRQYYRERRAVVHLARSALVPDKPLCGMKQYLRVTGYYDQVTCKRCYNALERKLAKVKESIMKH